MTDLNGHQLAPKDIPKDIRFLNQNGHEVQYLIDHKSFADDGKDDFFPIFCTHICESRVIFDSKSCKAFLNVSDFSREGKNINTGRKWQAPLMVMEAEVHEDYYSAIESDSEISDNEASNEDIALSQEVEDSEKTNLKSTQSVFLYTNQTRH